MAFQVNCSISRKLNKKVDMKNRATTTGDSTWVAGWVLTQTKTNCIELGYAYAWVELEPEPIIIMP